MASPWMSFAKGVALHGQFYGEIENTRECICHSIVGSGFKSNGRKNWVEERIIKNEEAEVIRENI